MDYTQFITTEPGKRGGQPCVRGMRITVRDVLEYLAGGEPNGWLYEVEEGGWLELETHRPLFNSPDFHRGLREYLLVDDKCVSVLAVQPPEILDLGTDPEQDKA